MRILSIVAFLFLALGRSAVQAEPISAPAVENAGLQDAQGREPNAALLKAQILLDRLRFSPGMIDGRDGETTRLAVRTFQEAHGLEPTGALDQRTWDMLKEGQNESILEDYEITNEDVAGPFVSVPEEMEQQAGLKELGYSSARELLSEKFHVGEEILIALNQGKSLDQAGTHITVPKVRSGRLGQVARLRVDKEQKAVRAYDKNGRLMAHYPATVGSESRPAPTGSFEITRVVRNPIYTYLPKYNFEDVKTDKPFNIAPGPNNPVGTVWIEINKDGYGLHGTPEPSDIGRTASHGCVRLTNWDAEDLATGVRKGVSVEFDERPAPIMEAGTAAHR